MSVSRPGAIVLGLDSAIGLTIIRELGGHGVPVHGVGRGSGAIAAASRYCASASERPRGAMADWLPGLIAATGARALLATSETDLMELSALPQTIDGCHILTPRSAQLEQVIDKGRTLAVAASVGLLVPQTWQPAEGDDFAARAADLLYPLVAKWARPPQAIALLEQAGLEWIKADYVRTPDQLLALLERYRAIGRWPLIQQYCGGVGLGQMLYMEEGQATLRFQHRRLHEWPPEGGVSTLCRAEPLQRHRSQMALSEQLLRALQWDGPAMVEYRYEAESGRYWLMEVNGRFWGSLPLAWHCGACFAWESYRRVVLGDREPAPLPRGDLRARYMIPETKRLARLLLARDRIGDPFFRARPLADLAGYLLAFLDPRMRYYVFLWRDPRPWLRDIAQGIRKALRRERR